MASINKLSIRGVRSFSPTADEQVVEFFFPCTIIVGANGCGKTTIIEALKFAVSGSLPPGKNAGQSFVNDPRMSGTPKVKAQIKLRFTNRAGASMVSVRSMELEKKKTKLTFKQLDGVLRTVDKHGNKQSLSHKCSELDKQIPMLLGISSAILEHVVFCHQEDSSWPLQDAATVKKNFDAIFDSSRYTKALEVFTKLKKEYMSQVKDLKADLAGLASHKHAAKAYRKDLESYSVQMENIEEEIAEKKEEKKENNEELNKVIAISEEIGEIENDTLIKRSELMTEEKIIFDRQKRLRQDLTDKKTVPELKQMLRDFESELGVQLNKQRELKEEIDDLQTNLETVRSQRNEMQTNIGRLQASKSANEKTLKERYDQLMSIASTYGLADVLTPTQTGSQLSQQSLSQTQTSSYHASSLGNASFGGGDHHLSQQQPILDIPQSDIEEYYRVLAKKEGELKESLASTRQKYQDEEDAMNAKIAEIMGKMNSIKDGKTRLEQQQRDNRNELTEIAKSLNSANAGFSRVRKTDVDDAKRHAAEAAKKLEIANNDVRKNEFKSQISFLQDKVDKLRRELEDDNALLKILRLSEDSQKAVDVLKEQCTKELEELQEIIHDSASTFQTYNIDAPGELPDARRDTSGEELTQSIASVVDDFAHKLESLTLEQTKASGDFNKFQKSASETKALLEHNQNSLGAKREAMHQLEGSVAKVQQVVTELKQFENSHTPATISESKPQELLSYLEQQLLEEESNSTEGILPEHVKKIMKQLKRQAKQGNNKYSCPCCKRGFGESNEIKAFDQQLKFLSSDDSPILKLDERNKVAKANYQKWKSVVSENSNDVQEYRRLANEVTELEASINELGKSLNEKQESLKQAKDDSDDLTKQVDGLRTHLDGANRWAEAASRIAQKRMQVNQKKADLALNSQSFGDRDFMTVQRDVESKSEEKDQYSDKINKLMKEQNTLTTQIGQLTEAANRCHDLARDKERKYEESQKVQARKAELQTSNTNLTTEIGKLNEEFAPLKQKLRDQRNEKNRMRSLGNEEEQRLNDTLNDFSNAVHRLKQTTKRIEEYKETNNESEFERCTQKSEELLDKANQYQSRIQAKQPDLDRLEKAIGDQESHKTNLEENIELIGSREKLRVLHKDIEKLEKSKSRVQGADTCNDDMERLGNREKEIDKAIARLEGSRMQILDNIRQQKRKLSQPEYKNVDEEHRVAMIKHETTNMAVRDIQKYHDALDKALLKYHGLKISEINKIIRELWTLTYKGEDIANIELVSGQDSGSRASRSYNYRVVMTKGNTQLDMRGRCSAGQRVLASIVVRLALAETFCVNCGCIALDEPTVNLDYNNKRGLAIALAQITASRASQRNFQLIMITHDEDFVAMMKTELATHTGFAMPEKYFHVRREEDATDGKFYSKIDAVDWDELL